MAPSRLFDYDYLKRLVRDHPGWSNHQYAAEVTKHEREARKDPRWPVIKPNTIAAVLSRYRDVWGEEGLVVQPSGLNVRLIPWVNIPSTFLMDTILRRLRVLERVQHDLPVDDERQKRLAIEFDKQLYGNRQVVDLTQAGKPYVRPARQDEITATGELVSYYARWPGLTDRQWKSLTPDQRRAAALRWLPEAESGPPPEARVSYLPG